MNNSKIITKVAAGVVATAAFGKGFIMACNSSCKGSFYVPAKAYPQEHTPDILAPTDLMIRSESPNDIKECLELQGLSELVKLDVHTKLGNRGWFDEEQIKQQINKYIRTAYPYGTTGINYMTYTSLGSQVCKCAFPNYKFTEQSGR